MPTAKELFQDGRLEAAIEALGVELRSNPADVQRRSFLFELLSFAGQYDRAQKQLDALAKDGAMAEAGAATYRAALVAERVREHMFETNDYPGDAAPAVSGGTCNGTPFTTIEDADPRIGARLEVCAGGRYLWIPFAHIASVTIEEPKRLRDLRWIPARLQTSEEIRHMDLGEVLLPALSPSAWRNSDPELRLGRATDWEELPDGDFAPVGQKVWRIDGREIPLVDIRQLVLTPA
jgi:type VI secretion system protein ImpE